MCNYDVIVLVKTCLHLNILQDEYLFNGYRVYRLGRNFKKGRPGVIFQLQRDTNKNLSEYLLVVM